MTPLTAQELLSYRPAPPFTVRPATAEDARAYAACHVACLIETYDGIQPDAFRADYLAAEETWVLSSRVDALADPLFQHHVAIDTRGVIVGMTAVAPAGHDGWDERQPPLAPGIDTQFDHLYTLRSTYGSGLGAELTRAAVAGRSVYLWVLVGNARARSFYAKEGFVPDGAMMPCGALWHFRMMERLVRRDAALEAAAS